MSQMAELGLVLKISLWVVFFFIVNYSLEGNIFKRHLKQLILIMKPDSEVKLFSQEPSVAQVNEAEQSQ